MDLIWSTEYNKQLCDKIYDCEKCCECCYNDYDNLNDLLNVGKYDFLNDLIWEDFEIWFHKNKYQYFIEDMYYEEVDDAGNVIHKYSELFDSVRDILKWLNTGICDFNIYKDKFNHVVIEMLHHDGKSYYNLYRLNSLGLKYLDLNYDFDYNKYPIKSVFKDFELFKY